MERENSESLTALAPRRIRRERDGLLNRQPNPARLDDGKFFLCRETYLSSNRVGQAVFDNQRAPVAFGGSCG